MEGSNFQKHAGTFGYPWCKEMSKISGFREKLGPVAPCSSQTRAM